MYSSQEQWRCVGRSGAGGGSGGAERGGESPWGGTKEGVRNEVEKLEAILELIVL